MEEKLYCPNCGSTNVERIPKPLWDGNWYCKDCKTIMSYPFTEEQYRWLKKKVSDAEGNDRLDK